MKVLFAASALVVSAVDLVTFDDPSNWKLLIDPVMGGQSTATASVVDGHGILDGEVKIVRVAEAEDDPAGDDRPDVTLAPAMLEAIKAL